MLVFWAFRPDLKYRKNLTQRLLALIKLPVAKRKSEFGQIILFSTSRSMTVRQIIKVVQETAFATSDSSALVTFHFEHGQSDVE